MWSDNETSEDLLGFRIHAELIMSVISQTSNLPVTIGVFGDWGSGKSSILKIIQDELKGPDDELKDDTLVLYFNGWLFEGYDDAKAALLESIIKAFEQNKTLKAKVATKISKLLKSVNWMRVTSLGFKHVVVPAATAYMTGGTSLIPHMASQLSQLSPETVAEKLGNGEGEELLKGILKEEPEAEETKTIRTFREEFQDLLKDSGIKKLVVLIDDLDRCTPERVIENLEAIKLFLNVEKTAFIIGADSRVVRHAIEFRYKITQKADPDSNNRIIDDYLEKLIQLPYNLPKLSESEVETYISLLLAKSILPPRTFQDLLAKFKEFREKDRYSVFGLATMKEHIALGPTDPLHDSLISIAAMIPIITQTLSGNPRQVKRFLNAFTLRKRLADVAKIKNFREDIMIKLMVLEYYDASLFKHLYEWQMNQKGVPDEIKKMEQAVIENQDSDGLKVFLSKDEKLKGWVQDRIMNWIRVDPQLSNIDLSDYFWLSRDKVASTIPGSSLIPPFIKALYAQLDQKAITDTISKRIIKDQISVLSEIDLPVFLRFCGQSLVRNPKTKRAFDIFHLLIDEKVDNADTIYAEALNSINLNEVPVAVAEAWRRYSTNKAVKGFLESKIKGSDTEVAKVYKKLTNGNK